MNRKELDLIPHAFSNMCCPSCYSLQQKKTVGTWSVLGCKGNLSQFWFGIHLPFQKMIIEGLQCHLKSCFPLNFFCCNCSWLGIIISAPQKHRTFPIYSLHLKHFNRQQMTDKAAAGSAKKRAERGCLQDLRNWSSLALSARDKLVEQVQKETLGCRNKDIPLAYLI